MEDDKEIGISLRQIVESAPQLAFVGLYTSAEAYELALPEILPDVVLLDIGLPGKSGIEFLRNSRNVSPSTQYLMCTIFDDEDKIFDSLKAGASGYIMKNSSPEKIIDAIEDIRNGGSPMSAAIARKVVTAFRRTELPDEGMEELTKREKEILHYLEDGLRYKEIAAKLNLSEGTVRNYLSEAINKLGASNRTEAARLARQKGWL